MTSPTQRAGADVQRLRAVVVRNGAMVYPHLEDDDNGNLVTYTDYAALQARIAELEEEIRAKDRAGQMALDKLAELSEQVKAAEARNAELEALINSPHNADWFEGVRIEAAHQVERWGSSHDIGKEPLDWLWLIGYLANKAAAAALKGDTEKAKHHTISTGAALRNWHRAITGESTAMRPGIDSTRYDAAIDAHAQGQAGEGKDG